MDENNNNSNTPNPQNDFDLDAALEEKFQQVQQDLDRLRAMNANACLLYTSPSPRDCS